VAKKPQVTTDENSPSNSDETEQLRQQLEELRGRAASAESALRDERTARQRAELAQMGETERRIVADQEACDTLLDSLNSQADGIEKQIAALADEPGHGAEVAKLNREAARIEAKILQEGQRKDYLASVREKAKEQRAAPQPSAGDRPLANGYSTANMSPQTKAWLDAHPKAYTDIGYCKRVIAYAINATDLEGIQADTPEYFSYLEEKIGDRQPQRREAQTDDDEGEEVASAESPYSRPGPAAASASAANDGDELDYTPRNPQTRAAGPGSIAAVAPPSRSIPGNRNAGGSKRTAALTADERVVADQLYPQMKNPADRYKRYAENRDFMNQDYRPNHFGAN
jgi:hypothetical protein